MRVIKLFLGEFPRGWTDGPDFPSKQCFVFEFEGFANYLVLELVIKNIIRWKTLLNKNLIDLCFVNTIIIFFIWNLSGGEKNEILFKFLNTKASFPRVLKINFTFFTAENIVKWKTHIEVQKLYTLCFYTHQNYHKNTCTKPWF